MDAKHYCVISRGVQDYNSSTFTSKLGGVFQSGSAKQEFLSLIK